jgi:hypothetical protein
MKEGTLIFFRPVLAPAKGGKPASNRRKNRSNPFFSAIISQILCDSSIKFQKSSKA